MQKSASTKIVRIAIGAINGVLLALDGEERAEVIEIFAARAPTNALTVGLQREEIERALAENNGNVAHAAMILKCSRRTLQTRMRQLDMPKVRAGRKTKVKADLPEPIED